MVTRKEHVIFFAAVAIIGSLLYFYADPAKFHFFPPCPFYRLTGFLCPGCGSQRAFHDLLHGDIGAAAGHNVLFLLFLPVVSFSAAVHINNLFRKKQLRQSLFYSATFARSALVVVLVFWFLRNLNTAPFNWLSS